MYVSNVVFDIVAIKNKKQNTITKDKRNFLIFFLPSSSINKTFITYTKYFTTPSWFSSGEIACSRKVSINWSGDDITIACCTALSTANGTSTNVSKVKISICFSYGNHEVFLYEGKKQKEKYEETDKPITHKANP